MGCAWMGAVWEPGAAEGSAVGSRRKRWGRAQSGLVRSLAGMRWGRAGGGGRGEELGVVSGVRRSRSRRDLGGGGKKEGGVGAAGSPR